MNHMRLYKLPETERSTLGKAIGILIPNDKVSREEIGRHIGEYEMLFTVGDASTQRLISLGVTPSVQIVDGLEMRRERTPPAQAHLVELHATNPAGYISEESVSAVLSSLTIRKPVRIVVEGEEDLLALLVLALAPPRAYLIYGQPKSGLVIARVDGDTKRQAIKILRKMGLDSNQLQKWESSTH